MTEYQHNRPPMTEAEFERTLDRHYQSIQDAKHARRKFYVMSMIQCIAVFIVGIACFNNGVRHGAVACMADFVACDRLAK